MTLDEIKDKAALESYYDNWQNLDSHCRASLVNKVAELYATEKVNELNERNSVDEGEKSFVPCKGCNHKRREICEKEDRCLDAE